MTSWGNRWADRWSDDRRSEPYRCQCRDEQQRREQGQRGPPVRRAMMGGPDPARFKGCSRKCQRCRAAAAAEGQTRGEPACRIRLMASNRRPDFILLSFFDGLACTALIREEICKEKVQKGWRWRAMLRETDPEYALSHASASPDLITKETLTRIPRRRRRAPCLPSWIQRSVR